MTGSRIALSGEAGEVRAADSPSRLPPPTVGDRSADEEVALASGGFNAED